MNLGNKIKELRQKHHMTQEDLALHLRVSAQAISKWERGVSNPDLYLIPRLAEVFEVSSDELLGVFSSPSATRTFEIKCQQQLDFMEQRLGILTAKTREEALETMLLDAKSVLRFDFTTMPLQEKEEWTLRNAVLTDGRSGLCFRSVPIERAAVGTDHQPLGAVTNLWKPQITALEIGVDMSLVDRIHIRLRAAGDAPSAKLQVFFKTDKHTSWSEQKSVSCQYRTGESVDLELSLPSAEWCQSGRLTGLRINPTRHYLDWCEIEQIELIDAKGGVQYRYDFAAVGDKAVVDWNLQNAVTLEKKSRFVFSAPRKRVYDPGMVRENLHLPIDGAHYLHVRLRNDPTDPNNLFTRDGWTHNGRFCNALLGVYFKTEANPVYSVHRRVCEFYVSRTGMIDLYVNMSVNGFWKGILTGLRIDPCEYSYEATYNVELVEILETRVGMPPVMLFDLRDRMDNLDHLRYSMDGMEESYALMREQIHALEEQIETLKKMIQ